MPHRFLFIVFLELAVASMAVAGITLVRAFHFELALVASIIIFFAASGAAGLCSAPVSMWQFLVILLVPLLPAQAEQWIHQPCDQESGFLFYFLYTIPALVCGAGAGRIAKRTGGRRGALFFIASVLLPSVWVLWTLYHDIPVRFHHWIFGMWPGSLYDEQVTLTTALWWGRLEGLLFGAALWLLSDSGHRRLTAASVSAVFVLLVVLEAYTGVRVPAGMLQARFSPAVELQGARIYFAPDVPGESRGKITARASDALQSVGEALGGLPEKPMELFVFSDPDSRYELTGARFTTYTKPWLGHAYLETGLLLSARGPVLLRHELAHLVTAPWGGFLGLPWNISLLEGTAVAVAPPAGEGRLRALARVILEKKPELVVENFLRRAGFWSESPASAYPLAGAFAEFVIESHGPVRLRELWSLGPLSEPPGSSWKQLAHEFRDYLAEAEPTEREKNVGTAFARQKSVFEKRCPHDMRISLP